MPNTVSQLPPTSVSMVTNAVNNWNANHPNSIPIDLNAMLSIVAVESMGKTDAVGYNYNVKGDPSSGVKSTDNGIMQLNSMYFPQNLSPADNVAAGVNLYGNLVQNAGGNNAAAVSAYNTGNVNNPINATYVNYVNNAGTGITGAIPGQTTPGSNVDMSKWDVDISATASAYSSLNPTLGNFNVAVLNPPIVVTDGLDERAWFDDPSLITGNPRLRKQVQPVNFQVLLHSGSDFILSTQGKRGNPINVQLNASMKNIQVTMKHNYHHQRTRTAHHITMWGMNADVIEGTCTTGVFMNQMGLTDYYSTRVVNDDLKNLVTSGTMFEELPSSSNWATPPVVDPTTLTKAQSGVLAAGNVSGGAVSTQQVSGSSAQFQQKMQQLAKGNPNFDQGNAFRVAAQDAFMEFLALFKMNGNVWFWNKLYEDNVGETRDWTGVQAWSPVLGMSSAQMNGRNNDVMTRGGVIMSYRNYLYQGYFKSLQWQMDAAKPYSWDFSFTFQVEKTIGAEYVPA